VGVRHHRHEQQQTVSLLTKEKVIMEIISEYGDASKARDLLARNKNLNKFAQEFCHEFNTRVSTNKSDLDSRTINLEMPNGIKIGDLTVNSSNGNPVYIVDLPKIIRKERSSKFSSNTARDSEKIPNLIRAIKKNSEQPTDTKVLEMFNDSIYYALSNINNAREPDVGLSGSVALDAIKSILGVDIISVHQHIPELQKVYQNYVKTMKTVKDSKTTLERFKRGCTMIHISIDRHTSNPPEAYYVADFVPTDVSGKHRLVYEFQTPLKRYTSLKESEYAPTATMIYSYLEGIPRFFDKGNELGVKFIDHFFEDMDFAVGYSDNKLVVLLPKHAP
jgi:hypothetical protein